jgi:ABC-2 type transport system permease protein
MTSPNRAASSAAGSIYDIGYRHYEGVRHGRWYAVWSLYVDSLRSVWGFGRPARAKAAPFIIAGLYAFYAAIQLAFSSMISQAVSEGNVQGLATYANYFVNMGIFIIFFCVAQAPELVCRDQRYQVLPLYFTRALGRFDYAIARLTALATAIFIVLMVPVLVLFVGDVLMKPDTLKAIGDEWPKALPALPAYAMVGFGMAALSLAISSFSPRRAYAAIGLLAYFLLVEAVPAIIYGVGHSSRTDWAWSDKLFLACPLSALSGASEWFFGLKNPSGFPDTLTTEMCVGAALISIVVFSVVLLLRYRRVAA